MGFACATLHSYVVDWGGNQGSRGHLEKPYLANRCRRQKLLAFKEKFQASEESFDVDTLLSRPADVALAYSYLYEFATVQRTKRIS
jgi:hypothetical protein